VKEAAGLTHDDTFSEARLSAADWSDQHANGLQLVTFRGCRLDMASFGFAQLTRVTFEDCLMAEASFLDARLECVRFHRCELTRGDFRGASLERCEFRGGDLTDLEGVTHLRGAAIDWAGIIANANLWAAALGIEILDAE